MAAKACPNEYMKSAAIAATYAIVYGLKIGLHVPFVVRYSVQNLVLTIRHEKQILPIDEIKS